MSKEHANLANFKGNLYRYQPYSGDYINYLSDLVLHNKIYYSSPLLFNDPFDCKLYGIKFSEESVIQFMRKRLEHQMRLFDRVMPQGMIRPDSEQLTELLDVTIQQSRDKTIEDCAEALQELHKLVENEIGVLCLSSDPLNILMYSHYADRHQGICLEFTLDKDSMLNPQPVRYVKDYPALEFGLSDDVNLALAVALISTKSIDWAYEQEHRSLRGGGAGIVEIPDHYLSGIIFGCAADDETIQAVTDVVKQSSKSIKLYRAVKSDSSFTLHLEKK